MGRRTGGAIGQRARRTGATLSPRAGMGQGSWATKAFGLKYTLVHKGKKIILLLLTSNEIVQCDRAIAKTTKRESEIQHDQTAPPSSSNAIKLKCHAMLDIQSDLFVHTTVDTPFHALVYRQVLFSLDDITMPLPHAITNLL
jgi:hypothetical protein